MTFECHTPEQLIARLRELTHKPSRKFEVEFVTPSHFKDGAVTEYLLAYWFIPRGRA